MLKDLFCVGGLELSNEIVTLCRRIILANVLKWTGIHRIFPHRLQLKEHVFLLQTGASRAQRLSNMPFLDMAHCSLIERTQFRHIIQLICVATTKCLPSITEYKVKNR